MCNDDRPTDLRLLIGEERLLRLARKSADEEDLTCFETCAGTECPHLCPPTMVPLLVYCYASGLYGSDEIQRRSDSDETIRALCGDKTLESMRIRRFRHEHRKLVQKGLHDLIWEVRRLLNPDPRASAGMPERCPGKTGDAEACEEEANLRLDLAAHADDLDADD